MSENRQIEKIARVGEQFVLKVMQKTKLGPSEYALVHCVRHHPGISPKQIKELLFQDKAAITRCIDSLVKKGLLKKEQNPNDHRALMIYATEQAEQIKDYKTSLQSTYYSYLFNDIDEASKDVFFTVLEQVYLKSKQERKSQFKNLMNEIECDFDETSAD